MDLVKSQRAIKQRLVIFVRNNKKMSKIHRTKKYLLGRIKILDEYWKECSNNHENLLSYEAEDELVKRQVDIVITQEYPQIEKMYFDTRGALCEEFNSIEMREAVESEVTDPVTSDSDDNREISLKNIQKCKVVRDLIDSNLQRLIHQHELSKESTEGVKRILDTTTSCLYSLQNLGVDTSNWDVIIIFLVLQKLPLTAVEIWENSLKKSTELPTLKQFIDFLENRYKVLELYKLNSA